MFLAVDGIDGAGKTTLVCQLAELLGSISSVTMTKEPTDSSHWGQKLRAAAIKGRLPREQELEFFHEDRKQHLRELVRPALDAGHIVISDRYVDSTLAFQALSPEDAQNLYERFLPEIKVPDVTFILKCPVDIGLKRLAKRDGGNLSQFETLETLQRARTIYESRMGKNYELLDASGTSESTIVQAVEALLRRYSDSPEIVEFISHGFPLNDNGQRARLSK